MVQKDEGLWCKIYEKKYLVQSSLTQNYKKPVSCSNTWASVSFGAELLNRGLKWRIGHCRGVKFWVDNWTDYGRLEDHATCSYVNLNERVCDYWDVQGWDVGRLSRILPLEIVNAICAIHVGQEDMEDRLVWGATANGTFSVKSAYLLNFAEDCFSRSPWLNIWKLNIPPKIKIFWWTLGAGKILTNVQRVVRKFSTDSSCFHCPGVPESLLHLFKECSKAKMVWDAFNIHAIMRATFMMGWKDWLLANLMQGNCMIFNVPWNTFFSFVLWYIWKWRCMCIFDNRFNLPHDGKNIICDHVEEWRKANEKTASKDAGRVANLVWQKPPPGVLKLNIDGARSMDGDIGAGGVLRNWNGEWMCGFMASMGKGEVMQAEAWALLHGLSMAAQARVSVLEVESDCAAMVNLLEEGRLTVHPLGSLLESCQRAMQGFGSCSLRFVHREENCVADMLAKASIGGQLGYRFLKEAPQMVLNSMLEDANGKGRLRYVHVAKQPSWRDQGRSGSISGMFRQEKENVAVMLSRQHGGEAYAADYGNGWGQPHKGQATRDPCCSSLVGLSGGRVSAALGRKDHVGVEGLQEEPVYNAGDCFQTDPVTTDIDTILCRPFGNLDVANVWRKEHAVVEDLQEAPVHYVGACRKMDVVAAAGLD